MNTLRELWKFVADIWDTGNYWVRLGIFLLAALARNYGDCGVYALSSF